MVYSRSFLKVLASLSLCVSFVACGGGSASKKETTPVKPPPTVIGDINFYLVSRTRVDADGFSTLTAKIRVTDRDNAPIPQYNLKMNPPIELAVNYLKCTATDVKGEGVCEMRSHLAGVKQIPVAGSTQTIEVEFLRAFDNRGVKFDAVNLSHAKSAAGADTVSATAGKPHTIPRQESSTDLMINDVSVSN